MNIDKYPESAQVSRVVKVIRTLFGHTADGLSPGEIAREVGAAPSQVTVMLAQLIREGAVEETHIKDRYRLGPAFVQGALMHTSDLDRAARRIEEINQRFSRRTD